MKISQVTACFNESEIIDCCVRNALGIVDEFVLVDGGSTDGTWERIQWWAAKQPFLKVVQRLQDSPPSLSDQINHGASLATGDWITYLDADVLYSKGTSRAIVEKAFGRAEATKVDGVNVTYYWVMNRAFTECGHPKQAVLGMRRHPDIKWVRPIHQLPSISANRFIFDSSLTLLDYGRAKNMESRKKKWQAFSKLRPASCEYGIPISEEFYMKDVTGSPMPQHIVPDLKALGWVI